jgi:hypothetical protein
LGNSKNKVIVAGLLGKLATLEVDLDQLLKHVVKLAKLAKLAKGKA